MQASKTKKIVFNALIAAIYATLSLTLAPISFGPLQIRISEALTLLPILNPCAIWGVTLGCLITNAAGVSMGLNILGAVDVVTGTLATLCAAFLTAKLGKVRFNGLPVLAAVPPIIINAVVIGAELYLVNPTEGGVVMMLGFMGSVGLGQFGACMILGLILITMLEKTRISETLRTL
ncbi:MAG: QueT transporter family protein [Oscillospiraceae bacterium]